MKRIWVVMFAFLAVTLFASSDLEASTRRGIVTLGKTSHKLKLPAYVSGGRYFLEPQVFVDRATGLRIGRIDHLGFHSERTGWGADGTARSTSRKIERDARGRLWATYTIAPTLENDWGTWRTWLKQPCGSVVAGPWINLSRLSISGRPWVLRDNMVRYGEFREPNISFVYPGNLEIRWNNNNLFGFVSPVTAANIAYVRWNGTAIGWFVNSATCVPERDYLGEYFCFIAGLPNSDRGAMYAQLKNGTRVWLNNTAWEWSPNVTLYADGTVGYVLPPLVSRADW